MDDVVAGHFVTGPNGEPWRSESMPVCIARKVEMNKALNQLTFTRSTRKPLWTPLARISNSSGRSGKSAPNRPGLT